MNGKGTRSSVALFFSKLPWMWCCWLSLFQARRSLLSSCETVVCLVFPMNQLIYPEYLCLSHLLKLLRHWMSSKKVRRPSFYRRTDGKIYATVYMHNKSAISPQKSWPIWTPQQQFSCPAFKKHFFLSPQKILKLEVTVKLMHKRTFNDHQLSAIFLFSFTYVFMFFPRSS